MGLSKNARVRRKSTAGVEQVKHRRTRSGCFTCRTRRVKCDETHPICERCLKGGRDCTYPEVVPTSKPTSSRKREKLTPREGSSSLDELEEEDRGSIGRKPKAASHDAQHFQSTTLSHGEAFRRDSWPTPGDGSLQLSLSRKTSTYELMPSPQTGGNLSFAEALAQIVSPHSLEISKAQLNLLFGARLEKLPQDLRFYMEYHLENLTFHHYLFKADNGHFLKTNFIDYAFNHEPLLYATVAFSSFHYTVQNKTGVFHTFLEYYHKAVSLLRASLSQPHTMATLLTILQLASYEEYMGDWGNLMQHRNAATEIISYLYTPETMAQTPERRFVYGWLGRFDIFAAMMAGHSATLDRAWSAVNRDYKQLEVIQNPGNIVKKVEFAAASLRDLAMEASILVAKRTAGLPEIEFEKESTILRSLFNQWWTDLDPEILEGAEEVPAFTINPEDEPFLPAKVYTGTRSAVNYMLLDYYGLKMLMNQQLALASEIGIVDSDLNKLAITCCKIIAAIQVPGSPPAALLPTHAQLALIALWLPPTPVYRQWIRKQLAKMEQLGYIFPRAFRLKIAELWNDSDILKSWSVPSDNATGIMIRQLVDVRADELPKPNDPAREHIQEMRALLSNLKLDSGPGGSGSPTTVISSTLGSQETHLQSIFEQASMNPPQFDTSQVDFSLGVPYGQTSGQMFI
ncbi:hypothetical protein BDZ91DRAFT_660718 [Kalaharituber pfeilii]|nr:hypothetical protein BDZ91DRAFT_660718 [Kalaharituber pfeilii]